MYPNFFFANRASYKQSTNILSKDNVTTVVANYVWHI